MSPSRNPLFVVVAVGLMLWGASLRADVIDLKPDHPERYTVVKGDTLWDIANRFLKSPWLWAKIWKINEQVENPHLIYPGDIIVLRWVDGQPVLGVERPGAATRPPPSMDDATPVVEGDEVVLERSADGYRMLPRVRATPREEAIPTIPPSAIGPFLTRPFVLSRREMNRAGYITIGMDDRIALGDNSEFYARGLRRRDDSQFYAIIRRGKALREPGNPRILAYEVIYLGEAEMMRRGDPALMQVTKVAQEIQPTDRLVPLGDDVPLPYFTPRAPKRKVKGAIIHAKDSVSEIGPFTIVVISLGRRDGMEPGHVLRVMYAAGRRQDPVTQRHYRLPNESAGLMMVFRTFEKVSYGLIMSAVRPIKIADRVITP